jgi:serine/threonine protein kinase/gas vesicle protein
VPDIESILASAVEISEFDQRQRFVDQSCRGDQALKARLQELIDNHFRAGSFLESPAAGFAATVDVTLSPDGAGTVIGPYKLLQQIGEGGMGTVFMAEQTQPVQRKVALKLMKSGMDGRQVLARFEAERQALALMDHPNIAKVLDAGAAGGDLVRGGSGRPYFVMELVKGIPITRYCDENHLTPRERMQLFVPVCQAVQHAHQKGIIHRDLKPTNVMVCLYDDKPVPKVIDFGLAKAAGVKLTERTLFTEFGSIVGTLEYMSPEQAKLNQLDIDTRSDIYSLGVLLYELLTGTTPLRKERFQDTAVLEVLRLIREEEPPRPSVRLSTVKGLPAIAADRGLPPHELSGLVRGELDWIVMKALEKDRNRRYETANELALDIERFLHNELVQACPPSAWYRLYKFGRRNRGTVLAACLLLLALLGGIVGTTAGLLQARASAKAERLAVLEARAKQKLAEDAIEAEEVRFALARRLADDMIQIAEEETAEGRGQQQRLRRRLLESAVAYYQEFIELRRDDPSTQADLESTRNRVQAILADLTLMRDAFRHLLLTDRAVQDDLKLSADARTRLAAVLSDIHDHHLDSSPRHNDSPPGGNDRSRQLLREMRGHETAIAEILSPAQLARLGQIALQFRGAEALQEPEVVAALNLSREQRTQLRSICGPRPGRHHGPGHDSEPRPTSSSEISLAASHDGKHNEPPPWHGPGHHHEAEMQKALALLSTEQVARWHNLTGPRFAGLSDQHNQGHDGPHDDARQAK